MSNYILWFFAGYISGSIPFSVFIAKVRGIDIFKVGSGNPGATNVMRSVGPAEGRICFVLDALKGLLPVYMAGLLTHVSSLACAALLGALVGHSFSIWINFRGGKGVATTIGGLLGLVPLVMLTGMLLWVIVFYLSGYVSLASILMAVWLPFGGWLFGVDNASLFFVSWVGALVILRHIANIGRLIKGTENRFSKKR